MAKIGEYADLIDKVTDCENKEFDEKNLDQHLEHGLSFVQKLKLDIEEISYLPNQGTRNESSLRGKSFNQSPTEERRPIMN